MTAVALPPDLAPSLRAQVDDLLAEVPLADRRRHHFDRQFVGQRCVVCHEGGKLGGHHAISGDDTSIVPVHRSCHRRLHRKGDGMCTA